MWYVCIKGGKIETIEVFGIFVLLSFFSFLRTSAALSIIQKQLTSVFLVMPSQYCLK